MKNFISEIRKRNTDELIYELSKISIDMYNNFESTKDIEVPPGLRYGKRLIVPLLAWDIPNLAFISVKESNDYRKYNKKVSLKELIDLYREYDDEYSSPEILKNADLDEVFRVILGMTSEQFLYQNWRWIFEKFNRDYYILLAATDFEHRKEINTDEVVKEVFGYSADDYIAILLMVFWLCSKNPKPLSAPENLYCRKENTILTSKNITRFIEYYSCTYKELREHPLGKQLLYSKPFIKTQKSGSYLSVSMFLVAMLIGNGLYWLIRDYYLKQGTQKFVNSFGLLFEDYIKNLAEIYFESFNWKVLSPGSKKEADFIFNFTSLQMLVESKSSLLRLDVKQQAPNLDSAKIFFDQTISEAYEQLKSSYEQLKSTIDVPILKIILLYDESSKTSIIEKSKTDIFEKDPLCFVMTIRQFEILLYFHRNDKVKEQQILDRLLDSIKPGGIRKNIGAIYDELSISNNPHFDGDMNYFSKLITHLEENLQ